jgi:hypothetical protein
MSERGRGRPPKDAGDIALIHAIRKVKRSDLSNAEACGLIAAGWSEEERVAHGYDAHAETCQYQLLRRYERIKREYGPALPRDARLRVLARALGVLVRYGRGPAARLLTGSSKKRKT